MYLLSSVAIASLEEFAVRPYGNYLLACGIGLLHYFRNKDLFYVISIAFMFLMLQYCYETNGLIFTISVHTTYNTLLFLRKFGIKERKNANKCRKNKQGIW
jgi:hypothetical protein